MKNHRAQLALFVVISIVSTTQIRSLPVVHADQSENEKTPSEKHATESIDIRYARAHLRLAKLDLRRAVENNQRVPGMLSGTMIEKLRQSVVIAEEQLKQAMKGSKAQLHEIHLRSAETATTIAYANFQRIRSLHEKLPQSFLDIDVERARAEVANLNLERARDPKNSKYGLPHLQWQVEELRVQLLDVQIKVEELSSRR
jgi:hypothetical protein